jgi:hypothetical protein
LGYVCDLQFLYGEMQVLHHAQNIAGLHQLPRLGQLGTEAYVIGALPSESSLLIPIRGARRGSVRGNRPVDKTGTAPRADFTATTLSGTTYYVFAVIEQPRAASACSQLPPTPPRNGPPDRHRHPKVRGLPGQSPSRLGESSDSGGVIGIAEEIGRSMGRF